MASTKHFVNDATHLVLTSLHSLTLTNPAVAFDKPNKIVYRRPTDHSSAHPTVSLVSGGGSGHEPSFAALVGTGLLSAAVAGTIFASPSTEQIRAAVSARVDTTKGVLVVIMNYTGDVLNFGVAVEKARAAGVEAEMVVVGDDVGVGRTQGGKVGRRGIAGTVLVHKIAGALAASGRSLAEVAKVARLVSENLVTVGASLDHVHVPGRAAEIDESERVRDGEVELGMGIHNEPGCGRESADLPSLVSKMLAQLLDQNDADRAFVHVNSNEAVLMVNNLGGVSPLELGAITAEVCAQLADTHGIRPARVLSGTYMTSLNAPGFSITLLNVVNTDIGGPSMVELLDAPAEAAGWSAPIAKETWEAKNQAEMTGGVDEEEKDEKKDVQPSGLVHAVGETTEALKRALERVIKAEPDITRFDTIVGDGDCGIGMKRGAEAILQDIAQKPLSGDVVIDLSRLTSIIEMAMDGTSGALYTIFLNALAAALRTADDDSSVMPPAAWAKALAQASAALGKYTPARPGDRTLMDALVPFVETLGEQEDLGAAAAAATKGAEGTRGMKPVLGRAVYVGGDGWERVPDPGAWGLAAFFEGLAGR